MPKDFEALNLTAMSLEEQRAANRSAKIAAIAAAIAAISGIITAAISMANLIYAISK